MEPLFLKVIHKELSSTFEDVQQLRLQHMENVLLGLDVIEDHDKSLIYGVDSYHSVFEHMIDKIFGTEDVKNYYPTFDWFLKLSDEDAQRSRPLRPDTILENDDCIYIIDSKYYRYSLGNPSDIKGLPDSPSLLKQIFYGCYVKNRYSNKRVYNLFLLPFNSKTFNSVHQNEVIQSEGSFLRYIGYADAKDLGIDLKDSLSKIFVFLIDLKYVINRWNNNCHVNERKELIELMIRAVKDVESRQST